MKHVQTAAHSALRVAAHGALGVLLFLLTFLVCASTHGQGVVGDVLTGNLVDPTVGTWAWYNLTDATGSRSFLVRLAIVGKEEVGNKTGHWLEVDVIPRLGFRSVSKMLLTGPAKDPANIHGTWWREGTKPAVEVPLEKVMDEIAADASSKAKEPKRKRVGKEKIKTLDGEVQAERYMLVGTDRKVELWINDEVKPMGIVRMTSPDGELLLRNFGRGGDNARSTLDLPAAEFQPVEGGVTVETYLDDDKTTETPEEAAP